MKETIYTIPINDAFDEPSGCPMCRLNNALERDALEYVMGAAMMEPDVRIQTNKLGFCAEHFSDMLAMGKRLPLALMLESYLKEQRKTIERAENNPASTCFVCARVDEFMSAYRRNLYYIWGEDEAFRAKLARAELCFPHLGELLEGAKASLKRKPLEEFRKSLINTANKQLDVLTPMVSTFCKSFDHRFASEPLGEAKTAIEQTIAWLTGEPRE